MGDVLEKAHLFIKSKCERITGSLDTACVKCPFFHLSSLHRGFLLFFPSSSTEGPWMVSKGCFQISSSEMLGSMGNSTVPILHRATWENSKIGPSRVESRSSAGMHQLSSPPDPPHCLGIGDQLLLRRPSMLSQHRDTVSL